MIITATANWLVVIKGNSPSYVQLTYKLQFASVLTTLQNTFETTHLCDKHKVRGTQFYLY